MDYEETKMMWDLYCIDPALTCFCKDLQEHSPELICQQCLEDMKEESEK
tara:strand:+ start:722 stop:868 length:147 start_codon:yes stop_codon:yes gene_type:complete